MWERVKEPHAWDDDVTVDGDFVSNINQNNHVFGNYLDTFIGVCDPPDIEPDDLSESNYYNYFVIGVVEEE